MHPVQEHLLRTNFRDLAGTRIEGTLALSEELVNLGVADFLQRLQTSAAAGEGAAGAAKSVATPGEATPDPQQLLQLLTIDQLAVRLEEGRMKVDVEAAL